MANLNLTQEKLEALRSEYKHRNVRGKYPRQKMLPEYQSIYPWVLADEVDPYFAFCTVCECRLSAKRSDLGKHEGSNKHAENAAKKGLDNAEMMKMCLRMSAQSTLQGEAYDDEACGIEIDADGAYIKQEPVIDLVETSNSEINLKNEDYTAANQAAGDEYYDEEEDDEDDGEEEEDDEEEACQQNDTEYQPPIKRRCSDGDSQSQHSSSPEIVPVQLTIQEASPLQRFSIREIPATVPTINYPPPPQQQPPATQAPCKITIKKITAPLVPAPPTQMTSTATITPVPAPINIAKQTTPARLQPANSAVSVVAHPAPVTSTPRDSYDLFFDSICASVKALPPKLATEAKIGVMQLIGDLEIRAITQREQESRSSSSGQQIVASTTK